ncbi:hypothetical protein JYB64_08755 [Algoriphagus aestuarii]|nr:hypothetical protein [Algoriphagus aestuarii]
MNQSFVHIASVNFEHSYFPQSGFSNFDLVISGSSKRRLNNLRLLFKRQSNGFNILSEDIDFLKSEKKPLIFQVFFTDPYFWNYSDLEYSKTKGDLIHLSNTGGQLDSSTLHQDSFVSEKDYVSVFDSGRLVSYLKTLESELQIESEEEVVTITKEELNTQSFHLDEGVYKFSSGDQRITIYYDPEAGFKKPDAIVSLNPDELFQNYSQSGKLNYSIRFKNRSTIWRYILADSIYSNFSSLEVLDSGTKELGFFGSEVQVSPSLKIPCLQSKSSIPLNKDFQPRFQLVDQYNPEIRSGKIIIKTLPIPDAKMIQMEGPNKDILYSDIFI